MHLVLGVLAATALSLLISLALVYLVRRYGVRYRIEGTADVEGIYMVALATLYGIFVAFMIFATWTRYYDTTESAGWTPWTPAASSWRASPSSSPMPPDQLRYQ